MWSVQQHLGPALSPCLWNLSCPHTLLIQWQISIVQWFIIVDGSGESFHLSLKINKIGMSLAYAVGCSNRIDIALSVTWMRIVWERKSGERNCRNMRLTRLPPYQNIYVRHIKVIVCKLNFPPSLYVFDLGRAFEMNSWWLLTFLVSSISLHFFSRRSFSIMQLYTVQCNKTIVHFWHTIG